MGRGKGSAGRGRATNVHEREGVSLWVMSRDVCKRGVDLHIFSDPRAPVL